MTWAYVEGDSIVEEHFKLPLYWKNYSNFFALESDVDYLKSIGWYRLTENAAPITNDQLEYHGEPEYQILHDEGVVIKTKPVLIKDNPPAPDQPNQQAREYFMSRLRAERNRLLRETDWTQMLDVQFYQSEEWVNVWRDYRQSLRDLPELYESHPLSEIVDYSSIQWPPAPLVN